MIRQIYFKIVSILYSIKTGSILRIAELNTKSSNSALFVAQNFTNRLDLNQYIILLEINLFNISSECYHSKTWTNNWKHLNVQYSMQAIVSNIFLYFQQSRIMIISIPVSVITHKNIFM